MGRYPYDEFSYFHENLSEWGLERTIPPVDRFYVAVDGLRQISGLAWGPGDPELVLLHGGAQNAHTFDTTLLALGHPAIALDLPGHGHSDAAPQGLSAISSHAVDVAFALDALLHRPTPLVGMSLGGLTAMLVAAQHHPLVSALILVDITPGVTSFKARQVIDFVNGPASFDDFESMLARTIAHHPTRSEASLRRGILHNALQREDGSWVWRHQRHEGHELQTPGRSDLWEQLEEVRVPVTLIRAMGDGSVVDDDDEAEFMRRQPTARVEHVAQSGHSIQGDQPLVLARLLEALLH